jgi:hypothetical protein
MSPIGFEVVVPVSACRVARMAGRLMSHSAGLTALREPMCTTALRLGEGHRVAGRPRPPEREPSTAGGYHGLTRGYLVGPACCSQENS